MPFHKSVSLYLLFICKMILYNIIRTKTTVFQAGYPAEREVTYDEWNNY